MFDYYKYNESEQKYSEERIKDSSLIITEMKSYYSIGVEIKSSGLCSADDSLFNAVDGRMNYNTNNSTSSDYFTGRKIEKVTLDNFVYVETDEENEYKLKLNTLFIFEKLKYTDDIVLDIEINLDEFNELGVNFAGFVEDCFEGFKVRSCYTLETNDSGEIIKTGVNYA